MDAATTRLNKYLALQLGISRREADDMISQGRVTINGEAATLGARIVAKDTVSIDGSVVSDTEKQKICVLLHKPEGYVCSRRRQGEVPTIYELLPPEYHELKPVGRLDKDSSGLILLSNDGDFAFRMTHPSFKKVKVYHVAVSPALEPLHQQMIADIGVSLEDGTSQLGLTKLREGNRTEWEVVMSEGRNRQIRRTFGSLGYTVTRLHRVSFGKYSLGDIKKGEHTLVDIH